MQCYVKSAGKGYEHDYTWTRPPGKESEHTCLLLRQMTRELSTREPSMAIFCEEDNYYLLIAGLKTGRTDIVGTPISNTFVFVCPVGEEQNIRFLTAGILSSNTIIGRILSSAVQEDSLSKLGFRVLDNFESALSLWLETEGARVLKSLENDAKIYKGCKGELINFLQRALPMSERNVLLVNSDKDCCSDFYMFSTCKIDFESVPQSEFNSEIIINNADLQLQNCEQIMNTKNETNNPLEETNDRDAFKIFLLTAPRGIQSDYYFWRKAEPEWGRNIKNLFPFDMISPELNYGIAVELDENHYHVFLNDVMQKITAIDTGRLTNVKLYFEFPAQIEGRTETEVESGIRSICASWTEKDCEYGNRVLRKIIESGALIIEDASFEVNEAKMRSVLWDFFQQGSRMGNTPGNQQEAVCHIAKDWSGYAEAKHWFGEKLRTTRFSRKNSLLCYFTPCEVTNPCEVSYCARWSREEKTIIPQTKGNESLPTEEKMHSPARTTKTEKPVLEKQSKKNVRFIVIFVVLVLCLIAMARSCSGSSAQEKAPTNMNQSFEKEEDVSMINKKQH